MKSIVALLEVRNGGAGRNQFWHIYIWLHWYKAVEPRSSVKVEVAVLSVPNKLRFLWTDVKQHSPPPPQSSHYQNYPWWLMYHPRAIIPFKTQFRVSVKELRTDLSLKYYLLCASFNSVSESLIRDFTEWLIEKAMMLLKNIIIVKISACVPPRLWKGVIFSSDLKGQNW